MPQDWMNDPSLAGIDPAKMAFLQSFISQGNGKNQSDLMPVLMAAASGSQKKGLQFSPQEIEMIVQVLKTGKSPQETARIDKMMSLMKMMKK